MTAVALIAVCTLAALGCATLLFAAWLFVGAAADYRRMTREHHAAMDHELYLILEEGATE